MQDIKFSGKNGDCPYFIYENNRFFIKDEKVGEKWKYSLYVKNIEEHIINFKTHKEVIEYIKNIDKIKLITKYGDKSLYETKGKNYIVNKNEILIKDMAEFIALDFDSYMECLKFAKKYVAEFIRKHERQISMF